MRLISGHATRFGRSPSRGFSLIEILVVVGIIAVLISLAVIGFKVVGGAAKGKVTQTSLESGKNLLAEFETTGDKNLFDDATVGTLASSPFRWEPPLTASGLPTDFANVRMCAPDVDRTSGALLSTANRFARERMLRDETARVIRRLMSNPKNRASIEALPADRVMKVKYPDMSRLSVIPTSMGDGADYPASQTGLLDGVNLIDGFGRPIYFIPPGGLIRVNVGYKGNGDIGDPANYDRQAWVRSADHRPFWASAGPDGNLTAGDDNVYSGPIEMK